MEPIAPSETTLAVVRAISRAGFAYAPTKALCAAAGWRLVDDERDLGYVRYDILPRSDSNARRMFSVLIAESGSPPWAFMPLFYFEEYDEGRGPFDRAFRTLAEQLTSSLGPAARSGAYRYPHRAEWLYSFVGWSLPDATLVLVQDEYDIQFGMDVTLWVQPAGTAVEAPVRHE